MSANNLSASRRNLPEGKVQRDRRSDKADPRKPAPKGPAGNSDDLCKAREIVSALTISGLA